MRGKDKRNHIVCPVMSFQSVHKNLVLRCVTLPQLKYLTGTGWFKKKLQSYILHVTNGKTYRQVLFHTKHRILLAACKTGWLKKNVM